MLIYGVVFFAALFGCAVGQGALKNKINILSVTMKECDNEITGKWVPILTKEKSLNKLSMEMPILKELNPDTEVTINFAIDGNQLPEAKRTICEAIKDEMIGSDIAKSVKPSPNKCPVPPGNYKIENYFVNSDKASTLPDGKIAGSIKMALPGKDPFVHVDITAEIFHETPSIG